MVRNQNQIGLIDYVEIISCEDQDVTSYDARLFDTTNGLTICEKNGITNDSEMAIDLGNISNIPINSSICELQLRKNGGNYDSNINIESIIIYHGNN